MRNIYIYQIVIFVLLAHSAQAKPLSLHQALSLVYATHPELEAAREELKSVDESVPEALSNFLPSANANYSKGRRALEFGGNQRDYFDTQSRSLTVEQPLFRGGRSLAAYRRAQTEVKSQRQELRLSVQRVLMRTVTAYTNLAADCRLLMISKQNVDALIKQLQGTRKRFNVGDATRADIAQADSRLAMAESRLDEAIAQLHASKAAFERATGIEPSLPLSVPLGLVPLPDSLEDALGQADYFNPSLILSELTAQEVAYTIDERKGSLLPDVSLVGTVDRSSSSAINSSKIDDRRLLVSVDIPLYQGGRNYARIRAAKHRHRDAKFQAKNAKRDLKEEISRLWQRHATAAHVIDRVGYAVQSSGLSLKAIQTEQRHGTRTVLDVLNAEQELYDAQVTLVRAERDRVLYNYQLLSAIGQLSARHLALDATPYDMAAHYHKVKWKIIGF